MVKRLSLLQQAKNTKKTRPNNFSAQDYELVAAWLRDEIDLSSLSSVKGLASGTAAYSYIAQCCREIWQKTKS